MIHPPMSEVEVSLQGTLETFALPDVLALLAATKKTGQLRVSSGGSDGCLWLDEGQVVGGKVPRAATLVDAVFELLRLTAGTFEFDRGAAAPSPGDPVAVDGLLSEARARLGVWREIEAVVPSTACPVRLAPELAEEAVTVSRAQWKALVAVAAGGDVDGVMGRLALGEFDACRTVKELADAGLVEVGPAPPPPPAAPAPTPAEVPRPARAAAPAAPAPPVAAGRPATHGGEPAAHPAIRRATGRPVEPAATAAPAAPAGAAAPPAGPGARRLHAPPGAREQARAATAAPTREEAEELVHQLAALGRRAGIEQETPAEPGEDPGRPDTPGTEGKDGGKDPGGNGKPAHARRSDPPDDAVAEEKGVPARAQTGEEPINRGMLLKFLSSVRP